MNEEIEQKTGTNEQRNYRGTNKQQRNKRNRNKEKLSLIKITSRKII